MQKSSGSQFFEATIEIQSRPDPFDEPKLVIRLLREDYAISD